MQLFIRKMTETLCAMWQFQIKKLRLFHEKEVLNRTNRNSVSVSVSQAIFTWRCAKAAVFVEDFMLQSISGMDGANEGFYHGMMLGFVCGSGNRYQARGFKS